VGRIFVIVLTVAALWAAGCGQEPPKQDGKAGSAEETTQETTEAAAASGSEFQGVVDSYAVAQEEIEEEGGEETAGEYRVGYIVEPAEGWWQGDPANLQWREPAAGETNHIEILPYDAQTGLLIPYMDITLQVQDEAGEVVDEKSLNFYWSEFAHYANNFSLPESGTYTLRADLSQPEFLRHGTEEGEGKVFTGPITVQFDDVQISTEEE
jgi:hypothetical protein